MQETEKGQRYSCAPRPRQGKYEEKKGLARVGGRSRWLYRTFDAKGDDSANGQGVNGHRPAEYRRVG